MNFGTSSNVFAMVCLCFVVVVIVIVVAIPIYIVASVSKFVITFP
jgi:hypothetical protein